MFSKSTLFILGAGASLPYGYPTGLNLVKEIINNIEKDEIFFPLKNNQMIRTKGREKSLSAYFKSNPGVPKRLIIRGGESRPVFMGGARLWVKAHEKNALSLQCVTKESKKTDILLPRI